jgi:hypothetical protein
MSPDYDVWIILKSNNLQEKVFYVCIFSLK